MLLPFITCLCLTRNRRKFLPRAIASFLAQDYAGGAEMVIVEDGHDDCRDIIEAAHRGDCSPHRLGSQLRYMRFSGSVGEKRNFGCLNAAGQVVAHFDDDDYSAPMRLTEQITGLLDAQVMVTGYHSLTCHELRPVRVMTEEGGWRQPASPYWVFREQHGLAAGTSLCYRKSWWAGHQFLPVQAGEDDQFYAEALRRGLARAVPGIERICMTNHSGSVSGRAIGGAEWEELPGRLDWLSRV